MSEKNSKIEWTDHTFKPWEGCQKVRPGCDHYCAETRNARFSGGTAINLGQGAPRRRTAPANWGKPLHWNTAHAEFFAARGRRVERVLLVPTQRQPSPRRSLFLVATYKRNLIRDNSAPKACECGYLSFSICHGAPLRRPRQHLRLISYHPSSSPAHQLMRRPRLLAPAFVSRLHLFCTPHERSNERISSLPLLALPPVRLLAQYRQIMPGKRSANPVASRNPDRTF